MNVSLPTRKFQDEFIKNLCARYGFLRSADYGQSLCGVPLRAYYLGNPKQAAILCGGFHGSEYLTVLALLRFLEDLCQSIEHRKTLAG